MISMSMFLSIKALLEEGLAKKAIARRLGLNVRTVRKQLKRIQGGTNEPSKTEGPRKLDRFLPAITFKVDQGLSGTQIYQDLCGESGFEASYRTVQRLVRRLRPASQAEVYCRMRFAPGEEAQIDFGEVARIPVGGSLRKVHLFVMTLCWSRLAYYELVLDQTVPTFLGAIRRGLEFLGGVPRSLKPDNLKSAVLLDALGQRYYQEDFFRFCRHYGTVPNAARPATPTDKGRCERDIGYAKSSCFRGRDFRTVEEGQEHLRHQACRRALYFGALEGAPVIERILRRDLQFLPLPETSGASLPRSTEAGKDYGRALEEYAALLGVEEVLHE